MGANLCSLSRSSRRITDHRDHDRDDPVDHENDPHREEPKEPIGQIARANNIPSAIVGLIRRPGRCLKITTDHKKRARTSLAVDTPARKKISKARKLTTLEDWLVTDSPRIELHVFKHYYSSRKVYPSSSSSSKARDSVTAKSDNNGSDNLITSKSSKLTKKVSFKDEPDVIVFYSPDEAAENSM